MTYARLDDLYDTKRKIKRAWKADHACVGLHAMAIAYTTREKLDGVVDSEWVEEMLPNRLNRERILGLMVDLTLFEPVNPPLNSDPDLGYWYIHDYLEFNESREERARLSAAGKKGAEARWAKEDMRSASESHSPEDAEAIANGNGPPHLHHTTPTPEETEAPSDVCLVFDEWVVSTERDAARTKLTADRRRRIKAALVFGDLDGCLLAMRNIGASAWARGANDRGQRFDDVEHAVGTVARYERWRDAGAPVKSERDVRRDRGVAALRLLQSGEMT